MPRSAQVKTYSNFSGGLVTEVNPLFYPENAAKDLDNMDFGENGTIQRRLGMAYDSSDVIDFPATLGSITATATNTFVWEAVNGDTELNIAVVQIGDVLHFYYITGTKVSSTDAAAATYTLPGTNRTSASNPVLRRSSPIQVSNGGGRLYVVGKYIDPHVLTFTEPASPGGVGTISYSILDIKVRDFSIWKEGETASDGSNDYSLAGEEKQVAMTGYHMYNLSNQGWPTEKLPGLNTQEVTAVCSSSSNPDSGVTRTKPARYTYDTSDVGHFPTIYNSFQAYQAGGGSTVSEQTAYSPWLIENDYTGNTPAPRGHEIQEAFYFIRSGYGDLGGSSLNSSYRNVSEVTSSSYRPTTTAFYAGRVWYAGLEGSDFTNNIYYSQVINDDINKAAKCYQEADPTAEDINELIATDGGLLNLEGAGKIHKITQLGATLLVVANNGVWLISGDGEFTSFTATSYSVRKITDQGAISAKSIVEVNDGVYYWGNTSLYRLARGQTGEYEAQDITSGTIKSFYQSISTKGKQSIFSVFDEGSDRVLWFYPDVTGNSYDSVTGKVFNKVLYFDINLGTFGKYSVEIDPAILPIGALSQDTVSSISVVEDVTDGGVVVTDGAVDVTVSTELTVSDRSSLKFLTLTGNTTDGFKFRFSEFSDTMFEDWGTPFDSYIETGFDSVQDIVSKAKKAPILQVYLNRTETGFTEDPVDINQLILRNPSGCLVSYSWDWEDTTYSNQFQAYRILKNYTPSSASDTFDYNKSVITSRNRLRGRGTSLGLRFESEDNKDLQLVGYGIVFSNRGRV